ncbi:HelD family protein [Actinomadura scrupuli]|uniref:HelD family protein n=1 Tax=Actinomadura scrupuli TaxID=559629 RepID=UPI003D98915C
MSSRVKDQEIAAEQERVDIAYARLEEMRQDAQRMIKEGFRQSLAGTKASLVDRDAMVYQGSLRAQALDVADDGLVFGRLDMKLSEIRYVGRIGVRTREHDSLVIDWRAPAAEAFYRATPEDPQDVIRRRVLHSRGHAVIDIEDDLLDPAAAGDLTIVGDGAFLASLARTRDGSMRDIVATIQREQDEVIRAPADGTVIVRGGPGTGKTAVALHRVAYLLFRHRRRFGTRGVLIVGPNRRFTSYIERVLPSLGEGSAALRSLGELVDGASASVHDSPDLLRIKGAAVMARVLRRAVVDHAPGAPDQVTVVHAGVVVRLDRTRLDKVRRNVHQRSRNSVNRARSRAAEMLLDALWDRFLEIGGLVDAPGIKKREFVANVRDQQTFSEFLVAWWPIRRPLDVLRSLGDLKRLREAAGRDLGREQTELLAASFRGDALSYQDIALLDEIDNVLGPLPRQARTVADDDDPFTVDGVNIITGEDAAGDWEPALRELTTSAERMERSRRVDDETGDDPTEYGHIVVDEAQDLSPMQWRMLGRRGRQATWTVVEDPAQSAWEDLEASRQAMAAALGTVAFGDAATGRSERSAERSRRNQNNFELTTNYRNSEEIAAVATRVLSVAVPSARPARAVRASGHEPVIGLVTIEGPEGSSAPPAASSGSSGAPLTEALLVAVREQIGALLGQVEGTIGVIVPLSDLPAPSGGSGSGAGGRSDNGQTALSFDDLDDLDDLDAAPAPVGGSTVTWTSADRRELEAGLPDRVQVLDVLEAKGLEFDAGLIVAPELVAAQSPTGLRTLYVAVSRATQRLVVLTTDPEWRDLLTG